MSIVFHCNTAAAERAFCAKLDYQQYAPPSIDIKAATSLKDKERAAEKVPRDEFKGQDLKLANARFNFNVATISLPLFAHCAFDTKFLAK